MRTKSAVLLLLSAAFLCSCSTDPQKEPSSENSQAEIQANAAPTPSSTGYADSSEGLKVYYEVYGSGEPIVVLAGGLMDTSSMAPTIAPLSRKREVIAIDLEGHGHTALRASPMSHERNADDVAAVLRQLNISKADIAGYSHGGDAAIRMAIQHPDMVRNLIVISTAAAREGWYPEVLQGMSGMNAAAAEQMKQTNLYKRYVSVAPHPDQIGMLLDHMGMLYRKNYDWRPEIAKLKVPALLLFADHDAVSTKHIAEFFGLFGGGLHDAGFMRPPKMSRARLAIVPGYSHYNFGNSPDIPRIIEQYLTQPTAAASPVNS